MANLWSISSPPSIIKTMANKAWITPQIILFMFLGFKLPLDVNMLSTYIAEFAEVIKKVNNKNMAVMENTNPPL